MIFLSLHSWLTFCPTLSYFVLLCFSLHLAFCSKASPSHEYNIFFFPSRFFFSLVFDSKGINRSQAKMAESSLTPQITKEPKQFVPGEGYGHTVMTQVWEITKKSKPLNHPTKHPRQCCEWPHPSYRCTMLQQSPVNSPAFRVAVILTRAQQCDVALMCYWKTEKCPSLDTGSTREQPSGPPRRAWPRHSHRNG